MTRPLAALFGALALLAASGGVASTQDARIQTTTQDARIQTTPQDARIQIRSQDARDATTNNPALSLQASLGFSDTFRPGRWAPLTVTISNRGAPVSGVLEVETADGDGFRRRLYPVVHRRAVTLGRDARRRLHFTVYLDSLTRPVRVRLLDGERVRAARALDLRTRFSPGALMLVVSRDADLDYLNEPGESGLRVLYPHPDNLPPRWQDYDGVAAMALHGTSLESLESRQFDALERWIDHGGTLVISGGPDYTLLRTPRLATLLPATPVGLVSVTDAAAVGEALGAPGTAALSADGSFHLNRVSRVRGEVLSSVDDHPLIIQRRRGLGRVVYLTFDVARLPFDRWAPMRDVWAGLLGAGRGAAAPVHPDQGPDLVQALLTEGVRSFPGHGTLLLFLALYLCVLATAYRIRRAGKRSGRRWSAVGVAIPVLFAAGAYVLFTRVLFVPGAVVSTVSVIEPLPRSRHARLRVDLGLFATDSAELNLHYAGAAPVYREPRDTRSGDVPDEDTMKGWRFAPQGFAPRDTAPYSLHQLEGRDLIVFDLSARVTAQGELEVHNHSGRELLDAWLVLDGAAWRLGTIAEDDRPRFDLLGAPDVVASDPAEWWQSLARHPSLNSPHFTLAQRAFIRAADNREERAYPGIGHALLFARTRTPLRIERGDPGWRHEAATLVLLRFPAARPSDTVEEGLDEST